jgi:hypothetical protein
MPAILITPVVEDERDIKSPDWHEEILKERKQRIESGDALFL